MPYVEKLKLSKLEPLQQMAVDFSDSNLKEIVSPFLNNIKTFISHPVNEIISLIKAGKTTKRLALLLAVSKDAIDLQRFLIRKKLVINMLASKSAIISSHSLVVIYFIILL